jgi:hypothetical protein
MVTLLKTIEHFEVFYNGQSYTLIKELDQDVFEHNNILVYYEDGEEVIDDFECEEVITYFEEEF